MPYIYDHQKPPGFFSKLTYPREGFLVPPKMSGFGFQLEPTTIYGRLLESQVLGHLKTSFYLP